MKQDYRALRPHIMANSERNEIPYEHKGNSDETNSEMIDEESTSPFAVQLPSRHNDLDQKILQNNLDT